MSGLNRKNKHAKWKWYIEPFICELEHELCSHNGGDFGKVFFTHNLFTVSRLDLFSPRPPHIPPPDSSSSFRDALIQFTKPNNNKLYSLNLPNLFKSWKQKQQVEIDKSIFAIYYVAWPHNVIKSTCGYDILYLMSRDSFLSSLVLPSVLEPIHNAQSLKDLWIHFRIKARSMLAKILID